MGKAMFTKAVVPKEQEQRYSQLLGFFYPQYRVKGYTSPLEEQRT